MREGRKVEIWEEESRARGVEKRGNKKGVMGSKRREEKVEKWKRGVREGRR